MQMLINGKVLGGEATLIKSGDMIVALTTCCEATGKGSFVHEEDRPAVVCRKCYREVDMMFGDFAVTADELVVMLQGFMSEADARSAHALLVKEA